MDFVYSRPPQPGGPLRASWGLQALFRGSARFQAPTRPPTVAGPSADRKEKAAKLDRQQVFRPVRPAPPPPVICFPVASSCSIAPATVWQPRSWQHRAGAPSGLRERCRNALSLRRALVAPRITTPIGAGAPMPRRRRPSESGGVVPFSGREARGIPGLWRLPRATGPSRTSDVSRGVAGRRRRRPGRSQRRRPYDGASPPRGKYGLLE